MFDAGDMIIICHVFLVNKKNVLQHFNLDKASVTLQCFYKKTNLIRTFSTKNFSKIFTWKRKVK